VTLYRLDERLVFPPAHMAEPGGLLAVGGDLRPERLLLGYASGIFPWYHDGLPILWHSPDPRAVLELARLHVPKSLRKTARRRPYELRLDTAFEQVIEGCARTPRRHEEGTWITDEMREAYVELHRLGFAHSAEAWLGGELVGGLYGVSIGGMYFGESMFARAPDASKLAFVALCEQLARWGFDLVDSQVMTEHLERFGCDEWPRKRYLAAVRERVGRPTRRGPWQFEGEAATDSTEEPG
jgi:leucyl/phenylalanyl-tRNA--protein transferase